LEIDHDQAGDPHEDPLPHVRLAVEPIESDEERTEDAVTDDGVSRRGHKILAVRGAARRALGKRIHAEVIVHLAHRHATEDGVVCLEPRIQVGTTSPVWVILQRHLSEHRLDLCGGRVHRELQRVVRIPRARVEKVLLGVCGVDKQQQNACQPKVQLVPLATLL